MQSEGPDSAELDQQIKASSYSSVPEQDFPPCDDSIMIMNILRMAKLPIHICILIVANGAINCSDGLLPGLDRHLSNQLTREKAWNTPTDLHTTC